MSGTLLGDRYRDELMRLGRVADPAQAAVVKRLDDLQQRLIAASRPRSSLLEFFRRRRPKAAVRGLYIWGSVGRGKTWLMDMFYDTLPLERKQRSHFHRFMQALHEELKQYANHADPLLLVADRLAGDISVLCFDEMFVADIADAMLLGELLQALFERGVTLVATSNVLPDDLYKDGLQRARFLPAIAQLKAHTQIVHLDSGTDYRLRVLTQAHTWFATGPQSTQPLQEMFTAIAGVADDEAVKRDAAKRSAASDGAAGRRAAIVPAISRVDAAVDAPIAAPGTALPAASIIINHRPLHPIRHAGGVIWFSFRELCDGPRSQEDYIELARCFHTVFVTDIPRLTADDDNAARRFISLVDEFYDRGVKLIISAAAPPVELYEGSRLRFEFGRTESRLVEMQSQEYLAREHHG